MSSVNKVILVGNLGKDPDIRVMQSGNKIVNLSIATSETWKDKNTGERREKTEWHRVVVFNEGIARVCENYLQKGSKVYIEGQLETRKWTDNAGKDNYSTEIVLRPYRSELVMLGGKSDNNQGGSDNQYGMGYDSQAPYDVAQRNPFIDGPQSDNQDTVTADEFDDDVPF